MRLLNCHIENFGKLSDFHADFARNPMILCEKNGWGKSTFAAFIKVMFYGFANESKRNNTLEKERVRYKPWQGGVYGGEITFAVGDKTYCMNRTFGDKAADDTFVLYDAKTNLVSRDYSANIGEELFQINRESFERTVYLEQNHCDTATTDSINAKIGNLSDNQDDLNRYEVVQKLLKDKTNAMSPTKKTGSIRKQKDEIAALTDALRRGAATKKAYEELERRIQEKKDELEKLAASRKVLRSKWESLTQQKALEARKTHYESILSAHGEKKAKLDECFMQLGGLLPDRQEFTDRQANYRLLQEKAGVRQANRITEQERQELSGLSRLFAGGRDEAEKLLEQKERIKCKEQDLEELRYEAVHKRPDEEEERKLEAYRKRFPNIGDQLRGAEEALEKSIQLLGNMMDKQSALGAKKATLQSLKLMEENEKRNRRPEPVRKQSAPSVLPWMLGGGVCLFLGVLCIGLTMDALLPAGILFCALGFGLVVAGILSGRKNAASCAAPAGEDTLTDGSQSGSALLELEIADDEGRILQDRDAVSQMLTLYFEEVELTSTDWENPLHIRDQLYGLREDVRQFSRLVAREADYQQYGYEARMEAIERELQDILAPFRGRMENGGELTCGKLLEKCERFLLLDDKNAQYEEASSAYNSAEGKLLGFLSAHGMAPDNPTLEALYEALMALSKHMTEYEALAGEVQRLETEKNEFEKENDVSCFAAIAVSDESEENVKAQMDALDEEMEAVNEQLRAYRQQLIAHQEELTELSGMQEELTELTASMEASKLYYERLLLVSSFLERAKENLSAKYIGPVFDEFKRYYRLLAGAGGDEFRMDADIRVTRKDYGIPRELEAFSAGNRDLVNIVLRVALVEVMYEKEKPFLILDDSFVNLDGEKLSMAKRFMEELSGNFQIIYFTCHESRTFAD